MARVAGGSILSLRTFIEQAHGPGAFERVVRTLPGDHAAELSGIILPVNWYSTEAFFGALHAAARAFDTPDLWEQYGTFAAEFEIHTFQKVVLRFTSPRFFLDRAGRIWHRFHDSGQWEVEGGDRTLRGTLRDFAVVDGHYCRALTAWIERAAEMTGVEGQVEHSACRARGDEACVFAGWWAAASGV
jgi:hypothetical protein